MLLCSVGVTLGKILFCYCVLCMDVMVCCYNVLCVLSYSAIMRCYAMLCCDPILGRCAECRLLVIAVK